MTTGGQTAPEITCAKQDHYLQKCWWWRRVGRTKGFAQAVRHTTSPFNVRVGVLSEMMGKHRTDPFSFLLLLQASMISRCWWDIWRTLATSVFNSSQELDMAHAAPVRDIHPDIKCPIVFGGLGECRIYKVGPCTVYHARKKKQAEAWLPCVATEADTLVKSAWKECLQNALLALLNTVNLACFKEQSYSTKSAW